MRLASILSTHRERKQNDCKLRPRKPALQSQTLSLRQTLRKRRRKGGRERWKEERTEGGMEGWRERRKE